MGTRQGRRCLVVVIVVSHVAVDQLPFGQSALQHGYSSCVRRLPSEPGQRAFVAKITSTLSFLDSSAAPDDQLYVLMDAFDTYIRHPPTELVRRVRESGKRLIISSEIMFSHQPTSWRPFFDALSDGENRYLNTGVLVGHGDVMRHLLRRSANSSFLSLSKGRGLDQGAIASVLVQSGFDSFRATLDYSQRVAYTASGGRWSLRRSTEDIARLDPVFVHFPFTDAPRVRRTFMASFDAYRGFPWPESDYAFCIAQERACAQNHTGRLCHVGGGHRPGLNRLAC